MNKPIVPKNEKGNYSREDLEQWAAFFAKIDFLLSLENGEKRTLLGEEIQSILPKIIGLFHENLRRKGKSLTPILWRMLPTILFQDRSEELSLLDMLSLGAYRMGLGCSGKILPSSSSPLSSLRDCSGGFLVKVIISMHLS